MAEGTIQTETELKTQPPVGEAKKLGENAKDNWQDRLIVFSEVKNKVVKVNSDIQFPLKLEEGRSTPVGLFAERPVAEKSEDLNLGQIALERLPKHLRATLLARVVFKDTQGNLYRDIDLKGMGFLTKGTDLADSYKAAVARPGQEHGSGGRYGLLDKETALYDYQNGEDLSKTGARVSRTIAIIELQELIVNGRKISLEEARKRGIIDKDFQPVIQVRAFGTLARIKDLMDSKDAETGKYHILHNVHMPIKKREIEAAALEKYKITSDFLLSDAKKLVAQQLGKESITDQEYLDWFAKTLGKNVALIHRQGWVHGGLHMQNITLDCRILDFDTLEEIPEQGTLPEIEMAKESLTDLFHYVTGTNVHFRALTTETRGEPHSWPVPPALAHLEKLFNQSYDSVIKRKSVNKLRKAA